MEIATSILSAKNALERTRIVKELNNSDTDYIHFDVMDGKFVSKKHLCIPELVRLIKLSTKKNDVHLMVEDPLKYIKQIKNLNVSNITIHVEINQALRGIIDYIKESNINVGLALDLDTNVDYIKPYLNKIDLVLIMTVKAGKGGQVFQTKALEKIKKIPSNIKIEIDGGVNDKTVEYVKKADIIVSGSYILSDIENNIKNLRQ